MQNYARAYAGLARALATRLAFGLLNLAADHGPALRFPLKAWARVATRWA